MHQDEHKLPLLTSAQFHTWTHSYFLNVTQWALHVPSWWKVMPWVSDPEDESEDVFYEADGWLEGREAIKKKKKRLWMNESLRGEKKRRVGKVCVCEQSRYTHTHTHAHVRTGRACSHHFCFPHARLNCLLPLSLHCRHLSYCVCIPAWIDLPPPPLLSANTAAAVTCGFIIKFILLQDHTQSHQWAEKTDKRFPLKY